MSDINVVINGRSIVVPDGTTVAAAISRAGLTTFRRSISGEPRGPLCGMGICHECRVTIDDRAHQRSCQLLCRAGQRIVTDD